MLNTPVQAAGEALPAAKINRRKVLAGTVALAGIGAPSAHGAGSEVGGELVKLIEAHRAAYDAFLGALDQIDAAEDHYNEGRETRHVFVHNGVWLELQGSRYSPWWEERRRLHEEIASAFDKWRAGVPNTISGELREAATRELNHAQRAAYRRVAVAIGELRQEQERLGLLAALEAEDMGHTAEEQAALALLSYPCSTIEECRAKAAYILDGNQNSSRGLYDALSGRPDFVDALLGSFLNVGEASS